MYFKVKLRFFNAHLKNTKRWKIIKYIREKRKKATYGAFKIEPIVRSTQGGKSERYTNIGIQGEIKWNYKRFLNQTMEMFKS